jgi:hypothetical protein
MWPPSGAATIRARVSTAPLSPMSVPISSGGVALDSCHAPYGRIA